MTGRDIFLAQIEAAVEEYTLNELEHGNLNDDDDLYQIASDIANTLAQDMEDYAVSPGLYDLIVNTVGNERGY